MQHICPSWTKHLLCVSLASEKCIAIKLSLTSVMVLVKPISGTALTCMLSSYTLAPVSVGHPAVVHPHHQIIVFLILGSSVLGITLADDLEPEAALLNIYSEQQLFPKNLALKLRLRLLGDETVVVLFTFWF